MKYSILLLVAVAFSVVSFGQKKISFIAPDDLKITADLYNAGPNSPVIVLCHQANSSRGEFKNIAPKLKDMGFTCLALDLRNGGETNGVKNETYLDAINKKCPTSLIYCEQDILAGIAYAEENLNPEKIILLGGSYSAAIILMIGAYDERIAAMASFSPGEYIDDLSISTYIQYLTQPVFATGARNEMSDIKVMISVVNQDHVTLFSPSDEGEHGNFSLEPKTENNKEYWDALEKFLKRLP